MVDVTGVFDSCNAMQVTSCGSGSNLYTLDLSTGATTLIGPSGNLDCIIDIAIDPQGNVYGVDIEPSGIKPLLAYSQVLLQDNVLQAIATIDPQLTPEQCLEAYQQTYPIHNTQ